MTARLLSLALAASLAGCAGATWTSSTTGLDGKTKVRGDAESVARHEAQVQEQEAYAKAVAGAPRRAAMDPIEVVVLEATVAENLKGGLDAVKAQELFVRELSSEPLFRVKPVRGLQDRSGQPPRSIDDAAKAAGARGVRGDVYVWPHLLLEDAVGLAKGKIVAAKAFTLKTEVASAYGTGTRQPSTRGSVLQNVKVLKDGAQQARSVILKELGPGLPSSEAIAAIDRERMSGAQKAFVEKAAADPTSAEARFLKLLQGGKQQQPATK
jgi:hypothetical protein